MTTIKKIQDGKSYQQFEWTPEEKAVKRPRKPGNTIKLTKAQVDEAAKLVESGMTHGAVAAKFGVSRALISRRLKELG